MAEGRSAFHFVHLTLIHIKLNFTIILIILILIPRLPHSLQWVLSSWHTSLYLPANAAGKTGSNAEKWGVPGRREGGVPAWPNLGLDERTFGSNLGPWGGPHVWMMKAYWRWSHPLHKEEVGENNTQISLTVCAYGWHCGVGIFHTLKNHFLSLDTNLEFIVYFSSNVCTICKPYNSMSLK